MTPPTIDVERGVKVTALVFFAAVAFWRLHLPGIYYDEVLFLPPAAVLFEDCSLPAGIYFRIGCIPVILQPPYIGSLKALIHAALHAVVPVGPISVRMPMLLVLLTSLWLFAAFWRRRLGPWLGLALFALLLTDVVAITHARVDWGPYVLAAAFKMLVVCIAVAWVETRDPWRLVYLLAAIALGVFDKLNFLWVAGGVMVGLMMVHWDEVRAGISAITRPVWLVLAAFALLGALWLVFGIIPVIRASGGDRMFDIVRQATRVWVLIGITLDGGAYELFYREQWPGPRPHATVFKIAMLAGFGVTACLWRIRAKAGRDAPLAAIAGWCAFSTIVLAVVLIAMVLTKETGGTHHMVVITQLWQLQLVTLIGTGFGLASLVARRWSVLPAVGTVSAAVLLTVLVVAQLQSGRHWLAAYDDRKPTNPRFSPAIYQLASEIRKMPGLPVVAVDWGIGNNLIALVAPGDRKRVRDIWPTFAGIGNGREPAAAAKAAIGPAIEVLIVMREPRRATFPAAIQGLFKAMRPDAPCQSGWREIKDYSGAVQYVVARVPIDCFVDKS